MKPCQPGDRLAALLAEAETAEEADTASVHVPFRRMRALAGIIALCVVVGVALVSAGAPLFAGLAWGAGIASAAAGALPSELPDDQVALPTTIYVKADSGDGWVELARFFDHDRRPVAFDDVAPVVYDAIVSSEDPRFFDHYGVDMLGTARAAIQNAKGGQSTQGGSSITQQYVKNLVIDQCERQSRTRRASEDCYRAATTASGRTGMQRKLREMKSALLIERNKSKADILIGYLNIVNFGGRTSGIEAAARRYFSVSASQLTLGQAATLVGIVQNPNRFRLDMPDGTVTAGGRVLNAAPDGRVEPAGGGLGALTAMRDGGTITQAQYLRAADGYTQTKARQLYVLGRMRADGRISRAQYEQAALEPIEPVISPSPSGCESAGARAYFCEYVRSTLLDDPALGKDPAERERALDRSGAAVYTTLEPTVQAAAETAMSTYVPVAVPGMDLGATVVSTEVGTGRVLALAQNTRFSADPTQANLPGYRALVYASSATDVLGVSGLSPLQFAAQFGRLRAGAEDVCAADPIDRIVDRAGHVLSGEPRPCVSPSSLRDRSPSDLRAWESYSSDIPAAAVPDGDAPLAAWQGLDGGTQSMIAETSATATTVVWVGNATGQADLRLRTYGGLRLSQIRHPVVAAVQSAADALYAGGRTASSR